MISAPYHDHLRRLPGPSAPPRPTVRRPALIETLLLEEGGALRHLDDHLARLAASARVLGMTCPLPRIRHRLATFVWRLPVPRIVRLQLDADGALHLSHRPLPPTGGAAPLPLALADIRTHPADMLLRHKTTRRRFLDAARERARRRHGAREVLFANIRGEITEGSFTNLFVLPAGEETLLTPPVACGLLPGILRQHLLRQARAREAIITLPMLDTLLADGARLFVGNDVRGLQPAHLLAG